MPLFFFHVRDALGETRDDEGMELKGLEAVQEEAAAAAMEYMASTLDSGAVPSQADLARTFQVTDESGTVVLTMPFSEALAPTWRQPPATGLA